MLAPSNMLSPRRRVRARALLFSLGLAAALPAQQAGTPRIERPRLVVLCAVDQLATWVFEQAEPHFAADGGFRRLLREGAYFPACAFRHACTETGPGHATIGTGAPARAHGIVRNAWWSENDNRVVYCVEDLVAPLPEWPEGKVRGPGKLLVPTLASSLKAHVPGSKAVSVAWKDRGAILMGGIDADLCVWGESKTGNFVTNTAWAEQAPAWLLAFNQQRPLDTMFGTVWERIGPEAAYAGLVDDRPYEIPHANGRSQRTLPQPITGGDTGPGAKFYAQAYASPLGNTAVRLLAEAAIRGEGLGGDEVPDLLCVGFSATDAMGHAFGPDSVEARDGLLRLDRDLATLCTFLDQQVGAGRWSLFLTADHGVGPTPEWARTQGVDAGRGLIQTMVRAAGEKALLDAFGPAPEGKRYLAHVGEYSCYFDDAVLRGVAAANGRDEATVRRQAAALVANAAQKVRGMATAIPNDELAQPNVTGDRLRASLMDSLCPGRAGDVQLVLKPYWIDGTNAATHGSPHAYDREVVGLAFGPGVPAGVRFAAPITPGFGAVLFARLLGIPVPTAAVDELPAGLLGTR
jgi:hypothetical protein